MMPVQCAWCGADMGLKDGQGVTGVSHGICDDCLERETRTVLEAVHLLRRIEAKKEKL